MTCANVCKMYIRRLNVHKILIRKDFFNENIEYLLNLRKDILYKDICGNYKIKEIIIFNNFVIKNFEESAKESIR